MQGVYETAEDNITLIRSKKAMNYVLAVIKQFNSGLKKVLLKARVRSTSFAVDVAEILRDKLLLNLELKISTDIRGKEGGTK